MKKKVLSTNFIVFLGILILLTIFGVIQFRAEFFDIFGLLTFAFFCVLGGWMLLTDRETPDWVAWIVLSIGILGLIVDGGILIKFVITGG